MHESIFPCFSSHFVRSYHFDGVVLLKCLAVEKRVVLFFVHDGFSTCFDCSESKRHHLRRQHSIFTKIAMGLVAHVVVVVFVCCYCRAIVSSAFSISCEEHDCYVIKMNVFALNR